MDLVEIAEYVEGKSVKFDPENVVISFTDKHGNKVHITPYYEIPTPSPKQWWIESASGIGYWIECRNGNSALVTPKDKGEFFEKYLKNLEPSEESPFSYASEGV